MFDCKLLSYGLLLALLQATVLAQTAPGFPFTTPNTSPLNVTFGTNNVSPAGELVPRPDTLNPPNITTPIWTSAGKAVLFMVDIDVPLNGTRVPLLHWLVSNVTLSNTSALVIPSPGEAAYLQPSPPVGDTPHAYTLIVFPQPQNFSIPAAFTDVLQSRVGFNISSFVAATGLGTPFAANYFRVQNLTGTPTATFPPPRPTNATASSTTSSLPEFTGAASTVELGGGKVFWVGVGTAIVAGVAGVAAFAL